MTLELLHAAVVLGLMSAAPVKEVTPEQLPLTVEEKRQLEDEARKAREEALEERDRTLEDLGCRSLTFSAFRTPWLRRFHWRVAAGVGQRTPDDLGFELVGGVDWVALDLLWACARPTRQQLTDAGFGSSEIDWTANNRWAVLGALGLDGTPFSGADSNVRPHLRLGLGQWGPETSPGFALSFTLGPTFGPMGVGWSASSSIQSLLFEFEFRTEWRNTTARWLATIGVRG